MSNPLHPLAPIGAPPNITPPDTPSSPAGYAMVTPHGRGPAPYNIQADPVDLTAEFQAAGMPAGIGIMYGRGPRQTEAATMMDSPPGFGTAGYDINTGSTAGWPADIDPGV